MKSKFKILVKGLTLGSMLFAGSAYAYTCSEAQGYTTALKSGTATINGVSVTGETIWVGTAQAGSNNAKKKGEGVLFGIKSAKAYGNNSGTRDAPNTTLNNYMLVKYTYASAVTFSDNVTIYDVDQSNSE